MHMCSLVAGGDMFRAHDVGPSHAMLYHVSNVVYDVSNVGTDVNNVVTDVSDVANAEDSAPIC